MGVRSPLPAPFKSGICLIDSVRSKVLPTRNCASFVSVRLREGNDASLGEALKLVEPVELFPTCKKVRLDHDRVAAIDGFGSVANQLHCGSSWNARAFEVPHS